jgi:hypothetical protein
MNGAQIQKCLKLPNFLGVFAADKIPSKVPTFCGFVVNTDPRSQPGTHWMAIYIDGNGNGEYFDSYGLRPFIPEHVLFLKKLKKFRYNKTTLQSLISTLCGQNCVLYLDSKFRGYSMNKILRNLKQGSPSYNENYIRNQFLQKYGCVNSRKMACQSCSCYKQLQVTRELILR